MSIKRAIATLENAIDRGFGYIGEYGIKELREQEEESDTTGRLRDSFSYSAHNIPPKGGPSAIATDMVPQPTRKYELLIGTRTPYAVAVNYGYGSSEAGPFQYGKNGNPANFDALYRDILAWMRNKGIDNDDTKFAYHVAKTIESSGTIAHPFWENSVMLIQAEAGNLMAKAVKDTFRGQDTSKMKVDLSFSFF